MNVLIACEESQRVCMAFRERGHNAFSCDIINCSGGHPEYHIKGDVIGLLNGNCTFVTESKRRYVINGKWDLIIAHPPCTYLTSAGACYLFNSAHTIKNKDRELKGWQAVDFFMIFINADCDRICVENPAPLHYWNLPKYTQIIEPYFFGDEWKKRTCLWLKNLPKLVPDKLVKPLSSWVETSGPTCRTKLRGMRGAISAKDRSKTFPGIARAMAEQWGAEFNV